MPTYTNNTDIPLSLAIWLCNDDYDYSDDPNTISATTLLQPIRAIVLALQNQGLESSGDISSLIPSRTGTALHSAIEFAWDDLAKVKKALVSLGYPKEVADKFIINPTEEELTPESIPVYMEQRSTKKVGEYTISGKYDFVLNGRLEDFKSTGAYSYVMQSNNTKYIQQGSIYRWLNPNIITDDIIAIQYLFTDWNKLESIKNPKYPKKKLLEQQFQLMSVNETDVFVTNIINKIKEFRDSPQEELPKCTQEELWVDPTVWKYYKNPKNTARSTKNFDNPNDAYTRLSTDGNVGKVVEVPGKVRKCNYCSVANICTQAQHYRDTGILAV